MFFKGQSIFVFYNRLNPHSMNGLTEPQKRIWRHLCSVNNSRCLAKCTLWTQGFNSFNRRTVYIVFVEGLLGSWQGSFPGINVHVLISAPPPPDVQTQMFKHRLMTDVQTQTDFQTQTEGTSGYNCDRLNENLQMTFFKSSYCFQTLNNSWTCKLHFTLCMSAVIFV